MYKKFRLATTIILILVAITIFFYVPVVWGDSGKPSASDYISDAILATPTPTPTPFPNAIGYIYENSTALQARIETADPQIRDGGWSAVRIFGWVPGVTAGNVECGWVKVADGSIYGFTQSKVQGQVPTWSFWGLQHPMETHTYRIKRKGSGTGRWKYYIDDISDPIDTRYAGFDVAFMVGSGGEVTSTANAMGVSGCLDNQYRDTSKAWHYYMYTHKREDYPYHLVTLPRPYSWQVYGHN